MLLVVELELDLVLDLIDEDLGQQDSHQLGEVRRNWALSHEGSPCFPDSYPRCFPLPSPPSIVSIAVSLQASAWYPSRDLLASPHTLTLNKNISVERWEPQI